MAIAGEVLEQSVKALGKAVTKRATRKAATTAVKKTTKAAVTKVAPAVPTKGIEDQITEGLAAWEGTKFGGMSPQEKFAVESHWRRQQASNLQPEIETTNALYNSQEAVDSGALDEFSTGIRGFADVDQKVKVQKAAYDQASGKTPVAPLPPLWKSGKGSRPSNTKLRENVGSFLQDRYSKTDELLDPEKRMDLINRKEFGEIYNEQGELMEISGVHSYMRSVNEGAPDPAKIKIGKVSTRQRGNVARIERMRAPEEELYKYASNNNISEQDVAAYLKEYSKGFNQVKKAASLNTKMGDPSDAGHWISTMASTGSGPLDRAATSKRAARIENRFQNRSGGAKSSHDMNPHAAEIVGIPRNWKEDFLLFLDQRPGGPNRMPNWMVEMQTKDLDALLAIPPDASKKEVEAVFDDLVKGWRKDKNHWAKQIKDIQRDLKVKKPSDNPDYYLYGKDQEIDEYAPIPGDPDFE